MSDHAMWLASKAASRRLLRGRADRLREQAERLRGAARECDGAASDIELLCDAVDQLTALPAGRPTEGET